METLELVLHFATAALLLANIHLVSKKNKQLAEQERRLSTANQALLDKYAPELEAAIHSTEYQALQQLAEYSETFAPKPPFREHWRPYAEAEKRYLMRPKNEDKDKP